MKINVIPVGQLSPDHVSAWSQLQRADPTLASPFFRPEFTQAVEAARGGVEVAVLEQGSEPVGFLPFERASRRTGKPVGNLLNEFQGAVARRDVAWCPHQLLRAAGLRSWQFDHLAATQAALAPFQYVLTPSPYLNFVNGFEHYRSSRKRSSSDHISNALQKTRKAAREQGDVRLENEPDNRRAIELLFRWKIEQLRRTREACIFDRPWVTRLFERLFACSDVDFSSMLLTLYYGDRLAAAIYGIASHGVFHGIVFAYDRELGKYSPGAALLTRIAQESARLNLTRLDLGKGDELYKHSFASAYDQVAEGAVHARALHGPVYRTWYRTKDRLRSTAIRWPVKRVRYWMDSTRTWLGIPG